MFTCNAQKTARHSIDFMKFWPRGISVEQSVILGLNDFIEHHQLWGHKYYRIHLCINTLKGTVYYGYNINEITRLEQFPEMELYWNYFI